MTTQDIKALSTSELIVLKAEYMLKIWKYSYQLETIEDVLGHRAHMSTVEYVNHTDNNYSYDD